MDKAYDHKKVEDKIYESWEKNGYFKPEANPKGKPYSIVLPPPNANAPLHFGHAMYVTEDILVRFHRMKGFKTLWLPGADHAGFETQFVFEKKLAAEGKSRLDYDRDTLYKMVWDYVAENRGGMEKQLKKLGFSLDWSRLKFTLDPDIVKIVYQTFSRLYGQGLVYRDYRLVNYCTYDGTSFSDLEVLQEESDGKLYHIHYPIEGSTVLDGVHNQYIAVATTRPETMFGDVAIMVHPKDKRYSNLIGKTAIIPLINRKIPIIADEYVDMTFGTGAVKVTPNHDFNDFEVSKRHNLPMGNRVIEFNGKMINTSVVDGLFVKQARKVLLEKLEELKLLGTVNNHSIVLRKCYKCKNVLEPLPLEQWFIKMEELAKPAIKAVKNGDIKIYPESFEKLYFQFLENIRDWNISRQVVWGIRIPAWHKVTGHEANIAVAFVDKNKHYHPMMPIRQALEEGFALDVINDGLQRVSIPKYASQKYQPEVRISPTKPTDGEEWIQETDTFDTWFSSGQWPFATLKTTEVGDFETFYPTTIMETGYDILRWWVARMIMLGIYAENKVPFYNVVLHGLVLDPLGKKMSKSKGNVVNPLELVDQYGADAVRFALIYGNATGNDQALSFPKLDASRKFANKLWNIGRYAEFYLESDAFKNAEVPFFDPTKTLTHAEDKFIVEELTKTISKVTNSIENYRFHDGADALYEFTWHVLADKYMEQIKERLRAGDKEALSVFRHVFLNVLKLLHPYMPFITEELWGKLPKMKNDMIIISTWPTK